MEFVNWIRNAGLEYFVQFREACYLDIVREFYTNLDIVYDSDIPRSLSSRVEGYNVELSIEQFRGLFQIPSAGARAFYRESDLNFGDVDSREGDPLLNVFRDITIGNTIPRVSSRDYPSRELGFQEYLAHRAIIKVVLPLLSTTDSLSLYQAFYIYALKHTVPVDFAAAILAHMSYVLSHPKCGLPYGHIITHLLRHLPIAFPKTSLPVNCTYALAVLYHLSIKGS